MRTRLSFYLTVPTLIALGCSAETGTPPAPPATDVAAVRTTIEQANARFVDALKRGDTVAAVANYAEDAVIMMPNEPAWRGRDGISRGFGGFLGQVSIQKFGMKTEEVMVAGDMAVETGVFEWTMQPNRGKAIKDKGKYLTVWKRQTDGSWKIVRDVNNSDLPAGM